MHIFSFTYTFSWHMHAHIHRHRLQDLDDFSTACAWTVTKTWNKVSGRNDVTGPLTSKSHTFQDDHGDVLLCLRRARRVPAPRSDRFLFLFFHFSDCFLSLSHCFFLFFLFSPSFLCSPARHVCSVVVGFSHSHPVYPPLNMSFPWKNAKQASDGRLQICSRGSSAAEGQQARSSSITTLVEAKLESTLINENNKKLRYLLSGLNSPSL